MTKFSESAALVAMATVAWLGLPGQEARAADWPSSTVTIVVPYSAGGSADRVARSLAPHFEARLGTDVVVENRPGASGQIGTQSVLSQPADGNTLLLNAQPNHSTAMVLQGATYDIEDLYYLNVQEFGNASVTVRADSPYKTFDDLHQAILDNPGELSLATPRGGGLHLMALLLADELEWDLRVVTYDSGAPVRTALLGGHVTFSVNGAVSDAEMKPEVRSLALSTSSGLSAWSDSPFINDALEPYGVEIPEVGDVRFLALPAKAMDEHPDRVSKLLEAYEAIMHDPEYIAYLEEIGAAEETAWRGPERSNEIVKEMHELLVKHKDKFK